MEQAIANDVNDDRTQKAKDRVDHYIAQQVAEGDVRKERGRDPRPEDREPAVQVDDEMGGPERFDIGSPAKAGLIEAEFDDGPINIGERRLHTPVPAPPTKRRSAIHEDEPGTKRMITGDMTGENDIEMGSIVEKQRKKEEELIICRAILGKKHSRHVFERQDRPRREVADCGDDERRAVQGRCQRDLQP